MTRDLRLYLLVVVLPAILLVVGGIRLVSLESARARAAVQTELDDRARQLAHGLVQQLKAVGFDGRAHLKPPRPPHGSPRSEGQPPRRGFGLWRRRPSEPCCDHDLPDDVRAQLVAAVQAAHAAKEPSRAAQKVEIRHRCGCTVVADGDPIGGRIVGTASLKPLLPAYSVVVAPHGGDDEVAMGLRAQATFAAILFLLLFGTLAAGVMLLVRAARRAREEARQQTDFLSNVSHELKTPLTSISMFAELLASGTLDDAARAKALSTLVHESKRLGGQIDGLLEFARLERRTRTYRLEDFDLAELADECVAALAPSFPKGLTLVNAGGAPVRADREAVRRILDALLENAAKYAADAGPVTVMVRGTSAAVADVGAGLAASDARHVFERFWRADNSVTRTTGGAGLGLAIAQELATGMGGALTVAPNAPHGCIFELKLKAAHG